MHVAAYSDVMAVAACGVVNFSYSRPTAVSWHCKRQSAMISQLATMIKHMHVQLGTAVQHISLHSTAAPSPHQLTPATALHPCHRPSTALPNNSRPRVITAPVPSHNCLTGTRTAYAIQAQQHSKPMCRSSHVVWSLCALSYCCSVVWSLCTLSLLL